VAEQLGHANRELTLRVYAQALPVEAGDMDSADFGGRYAGGLSRRRGSIAAVTFAGWSG